MVPIVVLHKYSMLSALQNSAVSECVSFVDQHEKKIALSKLRSAIRELQSCQQENGILYAFRFEGKKTSLNEIIMEIPDRIKEHIHITHIGFDDFLISYFKPESEKPIKINIMDFLANENMPIEIKEGE